jgi:hypothetical protein
LEIKKRKERGPLQKNGTYRKREREIRQKCEKDGERERDGGRGMEIAREGGMAGWREGERERISRGCCCRCVI